ncbi:MAG: class I SAM-dependent methyltransferase [Candidatus Acidiferrales bacterium]
MTALTYFFRLVTLGNQEQAFLGARWIQPTLRLTPKRWKRPLALRFVSLSPHYFYRSSYNAQLSEADFLESEARRNFSSRRAIFDAIVAKYLTPEATVLDYGCGPGYLAAATATLAAKVYACDIAHGVIACAEILNGLPNINYVVIPKSGKIPVPTGAVDLACSFAVVQHVTDQVLTGILQEISRVLKPGAKFLCHVVLDDQAWKSETVWRSDTSLKGRLKWHIGLHCFGRNASSIARQFETAGFANLTIVPVADFGLANGDDICSQHLCIAEK